MDRKRARDGEEDESCKKSKVGDLAIDSCAKGEEVVQEIEEKEDANFVEVEILASESEESEEL